MRRFPIRSAAAAALAIAAAAVLSPTAAVAAEDKGIAYPSTYRNWKHVKSMVILPGHELAGAFGGIHHIYANMTAREGYASGRFPDGAKIVFDLLAEESGGNALQEGKRKVLGVMVKDAKRYKATGGWGYEAFEGDSRTKRLVTDMQASCHGCHAAQKASDFVFSKMRD